MIFFDQVGRLLRFIGLVKKIVIKLNTSLKFVTSGALLVMFWVKISQAKAKGDLQRSSPWTILAVTALGTAVITSFLVISFVFASLLRLPKKSILAVTVLSSARHSSIAIAVVENLPDNVGVKDLMFVPIIFVYLAMIVIINSFGIFMKEKENNIDGTDTLRITDDIASKLNVVVNPMEQITSHDKSNPNEVITLPMVHWYTSV